MPSPEFWTVPISHPAFRGGLIVAGVCSSLPLLSHSLLSHLVFSRSLPSSFPLSDSRSLPLLLPPVQSHRPQTTADQIVASSTVPRHDQSFHSSGIRLTYLQRPGLKDPQAFNQNSDRSVLHILVHSGDRADERLWILLPVATSDGSIVLQEEDGT